MWMIKQVYDRCNSNAKVAKEIVPFLCWIPINCLGNSDGSAACLSIQDGKYPLATEVYHAVLM